MIRASRLLLSVVLVSTQLDVNNQRPNRDLSSKSRQWIFLPGAADHHHRGLQSIPGTGGAVPEPISTGACTVATEIGKTHDEHGIAKMSGGEFPSDGKFDAVERTATVATATSTGRRGPSPRQQHAPKLQRLTDSEDDGGGTSLKSARYMRPIGVKFQPRPVLYITFSWVVVLRFCVF